MAVSTAYSPPGVYTQTNYENPASPSLSGLRLPVVLGTGSEILSQTNLELVRGSSADVDQRVIADDLTGRAVVSISETGAVTLGAFDGTLRRVQVRKYPIVTGNGTGTTATRPSAVSVTLNGDPVVVNSISGVDGVVTLSVAPEAGDVVLASYYYKRTDTLITDDLSDQISDAGVLYCGLGGPYVITTGDNDSLELVVDGVALTITLPDSTAVTSWSATQLASFINTGAVGTSLVASTFTNSFALTAVQLTADQDVVIGAGSANSVLGLSAGASTARNRTFYTFNGPIVDGSNGGVTTTDPADVTVKVNGVQTIPVSVDGANRAVTLSFAPAADAAVDVTYYFNAWQDTYDELANLQVTEVLTCGAAPGRTDYVDGVDFVLQDDKIVWGAAALVSSGIHTSGTTTFDDVQVSTTLVDNKSYLTPCAPVVDSTVAPARESRVKFTLPLEPTTGNGRNSPLSSALFAAVANGRIGWPTTRPDLITAYWGFGAQDALERGPVTVLKVDGSEVTLKDAVPVGASVYATFYYNTLQDIAYSVRCDVAGPSGVGRYTVLDENQEAIYTPKYAGKSAGLAGVTLQFPSGSERKPDVRFEAPFTTGAYVGPVSEAVTVTFANTDSTLGEFTVAGPGEYEFIRGASDRLRILVDGSALASGAGGLNLSQPMGAADLGFFGTLVGQPVAYAADSGSITYEIDATNNSLNVSLDGVLVAATASTSSTGTLASYVTALNTASLATPAKFSSAGRFLSEVVITAGEYDELLASYTGATAGASGTLTATLTPGTYATAALLAAEVETALATAIASLGGSFAGLAVDVTADQDSRLVFALTKASGDASGYLEFITHGTAASDFAILAGLDTAGTASNKQSKVFQGPVARRFTKVGDSTSALLNDRLVLRSRVVPGYGTVLPFHHLSYAGITVEGSTGAALAGVSVGDTMPAAWRGSVTPATLWGDVGFVSGQVASGVYSDARDGQPVVTFYAAGGTVDQNNTFSFVYDGVAVSLTFTDATGVAIASGASAEVPLGPAGTTHTVLGQIRAAMTTAGIASVTGKCLQEGAGIRFFSALSTEASQIAIGAGLANSVLGFAEGQIAYRTLVPAKALASALMANSAASIAATINSWSTPSATYFAAEALAWVTADDGGAEYLTLLSQGTAGPSSSIAFAAATSTDALSEGTGLGVVAGDGASGEAGISGFFVTSTDPAGSGSVNTSVLNPSNDGAGQDGVVGQTYRDEVTGLTFSVLPRSGGGNYPAAQSFTLSVATQVVTDANLPVNTLPGVELVVANTAGVGVNDTAVVDTFASSGSEPAVGDLYYVSYNYTKDSFDTRVYTRFATIEAQYGVNGPQHPVTLASWLMIQNGAALVGIKQVKVDSADGTASIAAYQTAVDSLAGAIDGTLFPDVLIPLRGDSADLFGYMALQADIQSDLRHRAERTVIAGVESGIRPQDAGRMARSVARERFRMVYPDSVVLTLQQADGTREETLVSGTYLAAMLAGATCSPAVDVATPWDNKQLLGATRLGRKLDAVAQNQVAVNGITVIEDSPPVLRVRHGLTTDLTSIQTKIPTVRTIADEVQKQCRQALARFIGSKFLPGVLSQIEGQIATTLKGLVRQEIITAYTGIRATVSPEDPTTCEVEASFAPVYPLLYIVLSFKLRSNV